MRIVKPYGFSESHSDEGKTFKRFLHANSFPAEPIDIREFAATHPKLVIAQWISIIDKIITRPHGGGKPSEEQWALRNTLGQHAWNLIIERDLLTVPKGRMKRLERHWWSRVHPYGSEVDFVTPRNYKGRWYAVLADGYDSTNFDGESVARKVYEHLYVSEYRMRLNSPTKTSGLLSSRADSISKNVLQPEDAKDLRPEAPLALPWGQADKAAYGAAGDLAQTVYKSVVDLEGRRKAIVRRRCAALLQDHILRVLNGASGLQAARSKRSGCHALHEAIKECYKNILKSDHRYLRKKLPASIGALFDLVEKQFVNRRTNSLIRLGRVIHYEAAPKDGLSQTSNVIHNWPDDVSASRYWTTDGQTDIKRNEAFVRVWRGTLALASRTLTDWADPDRSIQWDILAIGALHRTISELDENAYDRKARLLFGDRSPLFTKVPVGTKQDVLRLALESVSNLRNSAYHFVGLGGFLTALSNLGQHGPANAMAAIDEFWHRDSAKRNEVIAASLKAANAEYFLSKPQFDILAAAVELTPIQLTDLPSLRRVLDQATAWSFAKYRLSLPARPSGPGDPAKECQYVAMKLIYERGFARWLSSIPSDVVSAYVERSISRKTIEARRATQNDTVSARLSGRFKITDGETIFVFFRRLEAALTAEMRESSGDRTKRKKRAKYLTSLQCDVIAQAFEDFLRENEFDWLLGDFSGRIMPSAKQFEISEKGTVAEAVSALPWQSVLYFVLHLVPVDTVSKLSHQLGRLGDWTGLDQAILRNLLRVMDLYQTMHDAKFVGAGEHFESSFLALLYESADIVPSLRSPEDGEQHKTEYLIRGMRELFRFGDVKKLSSIFSDHRVTDDDVTNFTALRSRISRLQQRRQELHASWVRDEHHLSDDLMQEYADLVHDIAAFRHLSEHVRLLDHLRLHRLLIDVLSRLINYAGQWERDVYFFTIAILYLRGLAPTDVFVRTKGEYLIESGQIIRALRNRNMTESESASSLRDVIKQIFGHGDPQDWDASVLIRNNLMHFNMLHDHSPGVDLTHLVNKTRSLMSYDRKQKNSVSKSVIDILDRNGMRLSWKFCGGLLNLPEISSREISHLDGQGGSERLHGNQYLSMVRRLF